MSIHIVLRHVIFKLSIPLLEALEDQIQRSLTVHKNFAVSYILTSK